MDMHAVENAPAPLISRRTRPFPAVGDADLLPLAREITGLRTRLKREARQTLVGWKPLIRRRAFLPGAANLADYLALRRQDIGALRESLSRHGLLLPDRCVGHVAPALDAVLATLSRATGARRSPSHPTVASMTRGRRSLKRGTEDIFGPDPGGPRSRVMVTLPSEIVGDPALARDLVAAGADCARINCAHGSPEEWRAMAAAMREAGTALGRDVRIMMDLAGPKLRLTSGCRRRLRRGDGFTLVEDPERPAGRRAAQISHPELVTRLCPGTEVWVDDGRLGARVEANGPGWAALRVFSAPLKGLRLKCGKGVNLPDVELGLPPLTEKDLVDLDTVATLADIVGFSFVQRPDDVAWLQRELAARRPGLPPMPVVLKIETRPALRNLPELIVQSAGANPTAVMLARGDLAVELGFRRLAEAQEEVLRICEAAHVPVIWATQVLEGLVKHGLPSRAEATDAALAGRAECVMLNKGRHLVDGVAMLEEVLRRMDPYQTKSVT